MIFWHSDDDDYVRIMYDSLKAEIQYLKLLAHFLNSIKEW